MNQNPCRRARLRWMTLAMIATGVCNACSRPTPPPPAPPQADAGPTDATPSDEAPSTPPAASAPDAGAQSPAPPAQTQLPATPPEPAASPPAAATHASDRPVPAPPVAADAQPTSIVVTTLSRGKGVPTQTRDVYKQIRAMLEQQQSDANITAMQVIRIGLEGETRLCAEFRDARDARPILARIRKLAVGVDLLNVAEEPCPTRKEPQP